MTDTNLAIQDLHGFKWRCIGPPRGGRVVAVAGDPVDPLVFYFGACAGGVWKTEDGGTYWECVSDGFLKSATIGALAVAPSDPNVVYAGTGETTIRIDVSYGDDMYKSTDAGRTWVHIGLENSKHIGEIRVHPTNPEHLYVAVFGDAFGASEERGVYRSLNGGNTWERVLSQNNETGAIDISLDPRNPRVIFAAFWQAHRKLWTIESGGPGSALFRSMDGGDTWENVSANPGFADGLLGKMGVAVSPVRSGRVFALVEASGRKSGLYRSDDYGASWKHICPNRDLIHRPWYYMHVFADTANADTVYVTNLQMWKSTDGGKDFQEITTPHGDNHDLWIDPNNSNRMIEGNDGGACVSLNGGKTWSSIYNQNTAQFYRMDIDNQFPYRVYATQQDNTSISVPSATEWGKITLADCHLPGTGESGFIAVDPKDPNIVYVGAVGSSPGGNGALQRYNHRTRQIQLINVWPEDSIGYAQRDLRYRFAWTFPIVFSPHDGDTLYVGGNHVFRTRDSGMSWEAISPDLSRRDAAKLEPSGGPLTGDSAGAEAYATCASVVESPSRKGEIWASTDDGLVHVTRDDGNTWNNVTPDGIPELAYVGCVEVSLHDPDTIYVAATNYKLSDYRPYLFRSNDGGASWTSIAGDLPDDEITRVVRADPVRPGLLFVGTETGIFFSMDDGACWRRMESGFPVVPVYDLKIKDGDLVAATHGRSFWVLDDITPLRDAMDQAENVYLHTPRQTYRFRTVWSVGLFSGNGKAYGPAFGVNGATYPVETSDGGREIRCLDVGENPPAGALIYYRLSENAKDDVTLTIRDDQGEKVAQFASGDEAAPMTSRPSTRAGLNRFVWDLRYTGPEPIDTSLEARAYQPFAKSPGRAPGAWAMPGQYTVELSAKGSTHTAQFNVVKDPRLDTTQEDFRAQFKVSVAITDGQTKVNRAVNQIRILKRQLKEFSGRLLAEHSLFASRSTDLIDALETLEGQLVDIERETPRDVLRRPGGLHDRLADVMWTVSIADAAPPSQATEVAAEVIASVDSVLGQLEALVANDISAFNDEVNNAGIGAIAAVAM